MATQLVVVGGSAGSIEALRSFVRGLPPDLPAAVLVVVHIPPNSPSALPRILTRAGQLPAMHARDGERLEHGRIYIAPPDHHLVVEDGAVRLGRGPVENGSRPAIDPLFRTAAMSHGARVMGVLLSGSGDDGAVGLAFVRARGGRTLAQDPDDALFPRMPRAAIERNLVDHIAGSDGLAKLVRDLVNDSAVTATAERRGETAMHEEAGDSAAPGAQPGRGRGTDFSCPSCGGPLRQVGDEPVAYYRCHSGHRWSEGSLSEAQAGRTEHRLQEAVSLMQEQVLLARERAMAAEGSGLGELAEELRQDATQLERRVRSLERVTVRYEEDVEPRDTSD